MKLWRSLKINQDGKMATLQADSVTVICLHSDADKLPAKVQKQSHCFCLRNKVQLAEQWIKKTDTKPQTYEQRPKTDLFHFCLYASIWKSQKLWDSLLNEPTVESVFNPYLFYSFCRPLLWGNISCPRFLCECTLSFRVFHKPKQAEELLSIDPYWSAQLRSSVITVVVFHTGMKGGCWMWRQVPLFSSYIHQF